MSGININPEHQLTRISVTQHNAYLWIIDSSYKLASVGNVIKSQIFTLDNNQWQLHFYPRPLNAEGLILYLVSFDTRRREAFFSFSIINEDSLVVRTSPLCKTTFYSGNPYGSVKFPKINDVHIDEIRILCQVWMQEGTIDDRNGRRLSLVKSSFQSKFDYKSFLNEEIFSDVKVIINGNVIYGHKIILSNRCAVFSLLLTPHGTTPCVIKLEGISYNVMLEFMRFLYTNWIDFNERMAEDLMPLAFRFGVPDIIVICEKIFIDRMKALNKDITEAEIHQRKVRIIEHMKLAAQTIHVNLRLVE